uniref:Uncharacterized protein n=1 Tax=Rhizophora mucronata TaxID=61149 RepID=A0A2P2IKK1_RHIMU
MAISVHLNLSTAEFRSPLFAI